MSTGVATVDEQHQALIKMVNDLREACLAGKGLDKLDQTLKFLGEYVVKHFAHEEDLMESRGCPSKEANKEAHAQFLQKYQEFVGRFEREGASVPLVLELQETAVKWLTKHICKVDARLRETAES